MWTADPPGDGLHSCFYALRLGHERSLCRGGSGRKPWGKYLIKVRGMTLPEAVMRIDGQAVVMPPVPSKALEPAEPRRLLLPEKKTATTAWLPISLERIK